MSCESLGRRTLGSSRFVVQLVELGPDGCLARSLARPLPPDHEVLQDLRQQAYASEAAIAAEREFLVCLSSSGFQRDSFAGARDVYTSARVAVAVEEGNLEGLSEEEIGDQQRNDDLIASESVYIRAFEGCRAGYMQAIGKEMQVLLDEHNAE